MVINDSITITNTMTRTSYPKGSLLIFIATLVLYGLFIWYTWNYGDELLFIAPLTLLVLYIDVMYLRKTQKIVYDKVTLTPTEIKGIYKNKLFYYIVKDINSLYYDNNILYFECRGRKYTIHIKQEDKYKIEWFLDRHDWSFHNWRAEK